jgi:membrane protein implicated in regulation of membrane protease activity
MESFLQPAAWWFIIGFIFLLLEFVVPGFILFFFGVGAWLVAILLLLFDISLNTQLIVFLIASIATVLLFRKWLRNLLWNKKSNSPEIEDDFVGKQAVAESIISSSHNGRVQFKGSSWNAKSADTIAPGDSVQIIGTDSITLIVKSI